MVAAAVAEAGQHSFQWAWWVCTLAEVPMSGPCAAVTNALIIHTRLEPPKAYGTSQTARAIQKRLHQPELPSDVWRLADQSHIEPCELSRLMQCPKARHV